MQYGIDTSALSYHNEKPLSDVSIIAGPSSTGLASNIAKDLKSNLVEVDLRIFSDGESKIKMPKTSKNCVLVQSTYPPVDRHLMQALMIAKKCVDYGAKEICAVIPYLAYARQDRAFLDGEVVTIDLVAKLLREAGVTTMVTVDIHSTMALSYFNQIKAHNISSIPLLASYVKTNVKLNKPFVVSPDEGGAKRAAEFAKLLNADMIALKKFRDRNTGQVRVEEKIDVDVSGRDTVIIDDMISSGGSIVKAAELLKKNRADKVYAVCAHALMLDDASSKITSAGVNEIISTNSIPNEFATVDLSPAVSSFIKTLF